MENPKHFDFTDFLLALGIFATFVVFGFCLWFLRREMKKKNPGKRT